MNKNLTEIPGYRYCEYLVVLNPHEDLRNKIMNVKKEFHANYDAPTAIWGKPHLTLATCKVLQMMEDRLVNRLKVVAMGMPPFKVLLKDYGSFPSHTIFINVTSKEPIKNLVKELRKSRQLMKSSDYDPYFIEEPHLTVARKLSSAQYDKAWIEYSQRSFTGSFIADGMLLLKRREGDKAYQIVQRFEFMNLPVTTKQGQLFM